MSGLLKCSWICAYNLWRSSNCHPTHCCVSKRS